MLESFRRLLVVQVGAGLALAAASAVPALSADADVLATVNGMEITEGDLAVAESELGQQFGKLQGDQKRAALLSAVMELRLLAAAAEEQNLGDSDEFERRMAFLRERALHSAFIQTVVDEAISEEDMRALYEERIASAPTGEEVKTRHILVETKEEAEEIIARLDEGGDFEALAKEHSSDGAASKGGDLGYITEGQTVPEFEEVAFSLEPGSYTEEPVETQFGFHVIKVEDKRDQQPPEFDAVKDRLRSVLVRQKYVEEVSAMRDAAEVEVEDPALKEIIDTFEAQRQGAATAPQGGSATDAAPAPSE